VLAFYHSEKTPERIKLEEGYVYFNSQFLRFQSMIGWPCWFWAYNKEVYCGGNECQRKLLISIAVEKQRQREKGGARVPISLSRAHSLIIR
jgi:hypothetical protein